MSSINLNNFVNINIVEKKLTSVDSTRDVTILFSQTLDSGITANETYSSLEEMYPNSIVEYNETGYSTKSSLYKYAYMYFRNGGAKLKVKQGTGTSNAVQKADIDALDRDEIVVASVENDLAVIASTLTYEGGYQKILLNRISSNDTSSVDNLATKLSSITGAEMSIAAYLSKINVYKVDSINDYAYTKEFEALENTTATNTDVQNAIANHYNVDIQLANSVRNIGGDMKNGLDLVNHYVLIILHQTLQDRLVDLLSQKIKGTSGISAIYSTATSELNKYVTSGYLTNDKIWTNPTLKVEKEGVSYTIIEQNTPIINGYYIKILPLSSLSAEDKAAHKAPYIYIILSTSYGIRLIEIEGEVI